VRILKIRLQAFRGVNDSLIEFAEDGVTIVEGPNEIGKTSAFIALDLLLSELDSSKKESVRACKPVNRDIGPFAEVELLAGDYHVVYSKRWLKHQETNLRILAPTPANLSGRPAHDRMLEILGSDIDLDLWRALRYKQGEAISQATVGQNPSLQAALDAASGRVEDAQGVEVELWTRVEQELQKFVTPKDRRPVADRMRLDLEVTEQSSKVKELAGTIAELEAAADELRGLRSKVTKLEADLLRDRQALGEWQSKMRTIEDAQRRIQVLEAQVQSAQSRHTMTRGELDERARMVRSLEAARQELEDLKVQISGDAPEVLQATVEEQAARESKDALRDALEALRQRAKVASADVDHHRKAVRVSLLGPRVDRVKAAVAQQLAAEEFLSGCTLTEEMFERLTSANEKVIEQRARLDAEFPPGTLRALASIDVLVNGEGRSLGAEEILELPLGRELRVVIPDTAELVFNGGSSIEERQDALATAIALVDEISREAGVTGPDPLLSARQLRGERQRHEQLLERAAQALAIDLEGRTPELLMAELDRLREEIATYGAAPRYGVELPATPEDAATFRDEVNREIEEMSAQESSAIRRHESAIAAKQAVEINQARLSERYDQALAQAGATEAALVSARNEHSDVDLEKACEDAREALTAARDELQIETDALELLDPVTVAELFENSQGVVTRTESSVEAAKDQVRDREALLKVKGESGLHEQYDAALAKLGVLLRRKQQIDRQARAAERLHDALSRHREASRSAHVAPLKAEIEKLGRMVFGPSFSVEIERENLTIKSRTVNGVTVPFESLSGGAKEQISMIARLACALIVAGTGDDDNAGVPIFIDDALGNSDPERLATLGAVIAAAGRLTQVIVLTCMPDRFSNVGSAKVTRLLPGAAQEVEEQAV